VEAHDLLLRESAAPAPEVPAEGDMLLF
jgi:hypothetical protein